MDLGIRIAMWSRTTHKIVDVVLPAVSLDATPAMVTNAIEAVGFADVGMTAAIGGSAAEYNAFREWARIVKGAGSAGGSAIAGEAVVVANTNAAAAYLLGAERLFEKAPKVEFGEVMVGEKGTQGTGGTEETGTSIGVTVTVKDGEEAVKCAAGKVAAMFEATSDLSDWAEDGRAGSRGSADHALPVEVMIEEVDGAEMRFKVTPGDGTAQRAFLRIRK